MIRYAGTYIPLVIVACIAFALLSVTDGELTWERPVIYTMGILSLFGAGISLIGMARRPLRDKPSLFIIAYIYERFLIATVLVASLLRSLSEQVSWITIPNVAVWLLLVGATGSIVVVNVILIVGSRMGWLDAPIDPVPFRRQRKRQ